MTRFSSCTIHSTFRATRSTACRPVRDQTRRAQASFARPLSPIHLFVLHPLRLPCSQSSMPRPRKNQKKDVHLRRRRPIYVSDSDRFFAFSPRPLLCSQSRFELLPHDIILKIFNDCNLDSRCPELLRLSHQLLPVSLEAFYSKVDLFSTPQYVKFYAAIRHRPRLGEWVRLLVVSANKHCLHWRIPEDLEMELDPKVSAVASRKLAKVKKEEQKKKSKGIEKWLPLSNGTLYSLSDVVLESLLKLSLTTGEFDPSLFIFCGELFRDIFLRLPNLTNLYLRGQALTSCLFHCDDTLLRKLLPRLRIANFYPRAEEEEDYSLEDRLLCSRLSRLGRLETVTFQRNHDNQPFVESDQPASSISLPPSSWNLEDLKLVKMRRIGDIVSRTSRTSSSSDLSYPRTSTRHCPGLKSSPSSPSIYMFPSTGSKFCPSSPVLDNFPFSTGSMSISAIVQSKVFDARDGLWNLRSNTPVNA